MAVVRKKGRLVDIPVKRGTVVRLRSGRSGSLTDQKGIVVGVLPPDSFSRAYGKQVLVCRFWRGEASIETRGAGDLYPVGAAKKIPKACRDEAAAYRKRR